MEGLPITAGSLLFAQGDSADTAYFVESGTVEILRKDSSGEEHPLSSLEAGQLIGEIALLMTKDSLGEEALDLPVTYTYSVRAKEDSTLFPLPRNGWKEWVKTCPDQAQKLILALVRIACQNSPDKLAEWRQKLAAISSTPKPSSEDRGFITAEEQEKIDAAPISVAGDITQIRVTSLSEPPLFEPKTAPLIRLPFIIGGYYEPEGMDKRHRRNHINVASAKYPPIVSTQHCQIEVVNENLILRELGSRFTTLVNGQQIGRGKGVYVASLKKGENKVQLGGIDSPVHLTIECL